MKRKILWAIFILLAAAGIAAAALSGKQPVPVETAQVTKGDIYEYVEEAATVAYEKEAAVYAAESGRIVELQASVGKAVKTGDILARLDDSSLRLELQALEAGKQAAVAQYAEAVKPAGSEEISRLKAQVASAGAALTEARRVAESSKKLFDAGSISYDAYSRSQTGLTSAEAALESAKSSLSEAQKGVSPNIDRQYRAQLDEIQAKIDLLGKRLEQFVIKAPIDGIITSKAAEAGSTAQPGTLIFEIGGGSGVYLESDILADDMNKVRQGAEVLISNDELGIKDLKGTVRSIYPKAVSKMSSLGIEQKRVKVEIDFAEKVQNIKAGYDMNIRIIDKSSPNTLLVNEKAVFDFQGKPSVFVDEKGTARLRAIEKGLEGDGHIEVVKGLGQGEQVLVSPGEKIKEGTRIKAEPVK